MCFTTRLLMFLGGGEGDKDDEVAGSEKVTEELFGGTPSSSLKTVQV